MSRRKKKRGEKRREADSEEERMYREHREGDVWMPVGWTEEFWARIEEREEREARARKEREERKRKEREERKRARRLRWPWVVAVGSVLVLGYFWLLR